MKTAMQLLIQYLDPIHSGVIAHAERLLELEKEQMQSAYLAGRSDTLQSISIVDGKDRTFDAYFSKKFS